MKQHYLLFISFLMIHLLPAQETLVNVFEPAVIEKLSPIVADLELKKGNAKTVIPVKLPEGCSGWFYAITITGKRKKLKEGPQLINFLNQLNDDSPERMLSSVTVKRTGKKSNIYLMSGYENAQSFVNYQGCKYLEMYTQSKSRAGYVKNDPEKDYFIGIENPYELKGLKVKVEVVAWMN